MVTLVASLAAAVLAVVLVMAAEVKALRVTPRSPWLSFAGGVAVAYVFLKLLPELSAAQEKMAAGDASSGWVWKHLLFITSLAGAAVLFGIEDAAKRTKWKRTGGHDEADEAEERSSAWVFWSHAAIEAIYAAFIGYLLFRAGHQHVPAVAVLGLVMAMHFASTAVSFADDYRSLYRRFGRWILAAAVLAGAAFGYLREMPQLLHHLLVGVLSGAVVFSVIKEEAPSEHASRFWILAAGIVAGGVMIWVSR